ncbi:hypothetical protein ACUXAV_006473 [Cupriavidus metallidurans]|nr:MULTISPECIES: hypothetical protein [Cupriavidus]KAB0597097.1 hypothetical protein F7R19_26925 [Cupriavidus pauculus]MCA3186802.1 hypothetical protein [Cupriavidus sp.]MCA3193849.1 hypothetical protein [Cupriavidus sp.]MCA3198278.1 hypothetical protein [Cupriavidus sp.]MCA3232264.1 hypothetical protein [Cupriavidus sp.]
MALNAGKSTMVGLTTARKPSKRLRTDVVTMQKRGVQVLLSRVEESGSVKARAPARSAYSGKLRVALSDLYSVTK